jgi:hypothetical protein
MDRTNAARGDLREAISAYHAYCDAVEGGRILVNADDDPADLVEAARLNVGEQIRVCQELGLSDSDIEQVLAEVGGGR